MLREEIAPLTPARSALQGLLASLATGFAAYGGATLAGWLTPADRLAASSAFATAAAAALAVLTPIPYAMRAGMAVLAGLLPLVLGASGQGALAPLGVEGRLEPCAGIALATLLPAALFFRSRYRAFPTARAVLAGALLFAVPTILLVARETLAEGTPLAMRVTDGLVIGATLTSMGGFFGPETTGACTAWGALVLLTYSGRVFATTWFEGAGRLGSAAVTAMGGGLSATVVSVGLYQLLAAMLAHRARLVDVHQIVGPSAEEKG
jgi:hypothetical protein